MLCHTYSVGFSYSGIVVELFGSTHTGFALKGSDINMNLVFRDCTISDPVSTDIYMLCVLMYVCVYMCMYVCVYMCVAYIKL